MRHVFRLLTAAPIRFRCWHNEAVRPVAASRSLHWRRWVSSFADRVRQIAVLSAHALWRAVVGVYNSEDLTHAASIAYYSLLSLLPFLLLIFWLLGLITASPEDHARAVGFILRHFPARFEFLVRQLDAFRASGLRMGVLGTLVLMWAALGVFGAVSTAVNHAWGVEKQRSYLKHKLVSFVMMVAAGTMLLVVLVLMTASEVVAASALAHVVERFPALDALRGFGVRYGVMLLLILAVGLVFYYVPNAKVRFRDVWIGALLTALLWRAAFLGFSWYVRDLSRFSVIHGSLATVVVFLIWIYISAVILLYGVEFTAAYGRLRRRRPDEIPAAPAPRG